MATFGAVFFGGAASSVPLFIMKGDRKMGLFDVLNKIVSIAEGNYQKYSSKVNRYIERFADKEDYELREIWEDSSRSSEEKLAAQVVYKRRHS